MGESVASQRTVAEVEEEIVITRQSISRVLHLGIQNQNQSGGSSRMMMDSSLSELRKHLVSLQRELSALQNPAFIVKAGW